MPPELVSHDRADAVVNAMCDRSRIVHAAWLAPGKEATLDGEGNMYAGFDYLVGGTPEPWWDVADQIVAAQPFFRYVVHDAVAAAGRADRIPDLCRDWSALLDDGRRPGARPGSVAAIATAGVDTHS